jgi:hypothetical protein
MPNGWHSTLTRLLNLCAPASQDGTEVFFKIKRKSPLKKLMDVYAQRQGGTPSAYRFIFDGNRIVETQTPDDVCSPPLLSSPPLPPVPPLPPPPIRWSVVSPFNAPSPPHVSPAVGVQLDMENDDVIDAMLEQVGGSF